MQKRIELDWQDLRFFLAILRGGSLGAAAERLKVDPSTVGRRLLALQEAVGARLLDRTPNGYRPTSVGERILPAAERMEAEALAVERALGGVKAEIEGVVRVTATEGIGAFFVAPSLAALRRAYPHLELELVIDPRSLSLSRREADLALRLARPHQAGLVARRIADVAFALYGAPAYLEERGSPPTSGDLAGHEVIGNDESLTDLPESRWMALRARNATSALRTNNVFVQLQAAQAGLGLALLPCYLADAAPLVRALPLSAGLQRELWLVVHSDLQRTARIRAVMDFLAVRAKARAGAFGGKRSSLAPARER